MPKYVYFFENGKADGNAKMKALLGGKGANLAEMARWACPCLPVLQSLPMYAHVFMSVAGSIRSN